MPTLSLSILEIIVLMLGTVFLGITIHFFIVSRRSLNRTTQPVSRNNKDLEQWKSRYFNDLESKERELIHLRKQLEELEQSGNIYTVESDELRRENKKLKLELDSIKNSGPTQGTVSFVGQLKLAQDSLLEQHERIHILLEQIDVVKENEHRLNEIMGENEALSVEVEELKRSLAEKERELSQTHQKQALTGEMSSLLDNTYREFELLQEKIQKLESQVSNSQMNSLDYENLKEEHEKLQEEFESERNQLYGITLNNKQLQLQLAEAENKLREANFQCQQLQKRVSYLEELNKDMQLVAETNKKLQSQLKRIGELESMLNVMAEERAELMRRQMSSQ